MKSLFSSFIFLIFSSSLMAQEGTFTKVGEIDPAAKKILDRLKADYQDFENVDLEFKLELEFPGDSPEFRKGSVSQKGDKFRLNMGEQELICNGEVIWVYLRDANEVQINDFEDEDASEFMSPKDVFHMYDSGEFTYAVTNQFEEQGKRITEIEFKPISRDFEYSKMRLTLGNNDQEVKNLKVFAKDGSRYTMHIEKMNVEKKLDDKLFIFDKNQYPGVTIEDLRL